MFNQCSGLFRRAKSAKRTHREKNRRYLRHGQALRRGAAHDAIALPPPRDTNEAA
jgi:hypothetical protein